MSPGQEPLEVYEIEVRPGETASMALPAGTPEDEVARLARAVREAALSLPPGHGTDIKGEQR